MKKISLYDERIEKNRFHKKSYIVTRGRKIRIAIMMGLIEENWSYIEEALELLTDKGSFDLDIAPGYKSNVRYEFPNQIIEDFEV